MTPVKFNNWLKELDHLTDEQKQKLKSYLQNQAPEKQIIASIDQRLIDKPE